MRRLISLLILLVLALPGVTLPALAEEPPKAETLAQAAPAQAAPAQATPAQATPAQATPAQAAPITQAPAEAAPAQHDAPSRQHARVTWQQRFAQADLAHDGHLTPEEAKSGYPLIAKHFKDIDVDNKGYVTENDLRAWRIMRKAAHRLAQPPQDKLKPQHAYQRNSIDPRQMPVVPTAAAPART